MKNKTVYFFTLVLVALLLTACGPKGEVVLNITGNVAKQTELTDVKINGMKNTEAEYTNKDGETSTYTGVLITTLLEEASLNQDAASITFVANDGYSADMTLEELNSCAGCILTPGDEGGYNLVMPGFSGKLQVKGVVEIQVK